MYAVIKTGGKQYRVQPGDLIKVEKLAGSPGDDVVFSDVLMVAGDAEVKIGTPLVKGAKVVGKIVQQARDKKVIIFKHKRRKGYRLKKGHRQYFTAVAIKSIEAGGAV